MNIIDAGKLLYRFGGWIATENGASLGFFINDDLKMSDSFSDWTPSIYNILTKTYLYFDKDKKCLTCKTCYKLLEDMEGLSPVCECNLEWPEGLMKYYDKNGILQIPEEVKATRAAPREESEDMQKPYAASVKIGDTLHISHSDIARLKSIKCENCSRYKKSQMVENDWCRCRLLACEGRELQGKEAEAILDSEPLYKKPQYPGMIEVNYLDGCTRIFHYVSLSMSVCMGGFYVHNDQARIESAIVNTIDESEDWGRSYEVSPEEYHRILNLFKASGLEVRE